MKRYRPGAMTDMVESCFYCMRRLVWVFAAALILVACPPTPQPKPPVPDAGGGLVSTGGSQPIPPAVGGAHSTGGASASTGGKAATGGSSAAPGNLAHCIADLTKDPGVANVAKRQGLTAKALATKECSDPNVLARHP